ncbi:hypothetical protein BCP78_0220 [Bacillus phage BCP78]|uniref:DUF7349 domain-containing protein n=3 Tax=Tsarbombavirus BCP78 TaxID=1985182 RepID=J9PS05_9CAUD|nr:hypothetical protein BCP78_0220 [Bacillus phage BCP78]YP_009783582.1 hypothetical protein QLX27_gp209 [Bacillus phage BCU4]AEW47227.1 hypothetical protein BCP78_0220 [Bacillus phage BCP78]AEW47715.1 hypothetical protein BCU4_0209 [Bacillus phage BCU4]AQN32595.1 hypothetical protein BCP12_195 [Bacillus phage BCP12]
MLVNPVFAGKSVATIFGQVVFNEKGENNELPIEQQKELGQVPGYTFVDNEPKKATPKKAASKAKTEEKE